MILYDFTLSLYPPWVTKSGKRKKFGHFCAEAGAKDVRLFKDQNSNSICNHLGHELPIYR
jgi:hypothetical protein